MTVIVSFDSYTPVIRYDEMPWTLAIIEEADTSTGTWNTIATLPLNPPDPDPSNPMPRSFTTASGTAADLWYRVTFEDDAANRSLPTVPLQNTATTRQMYADIDELARILHVVVTADTEPPLRRVLTAASNEIDSELGRATPFSLVPALVMEVTLERAVEHWQQMKSPFGIVGLGAEAGPTVTATDTWHRHAHKLAPYKESWGFA